MLVVCLLCSNVRSALDHHFEARNYASKVAVKVAPGVHRRGIDEGKIPETLRKLLRLGHICLSDKYRNGGKAIVQRSLNFNSNRIVVVLDSAMAAFAAAEPFRPDDDEDRIGFRQGFLNMHPEILAERYVINVYED